MNLKSKQRYEISTLDRIIKGGSIDNWDGIMNGVSLFNKRAFYRNGSEKRFNPEEVYFDINGRGKSGFETGDKSELVRLNKLLKAKERYDLLITEWTRDIRDGLLTCKELAEDGFTKEADRIYNKIKQSDCRQSLACLVLNFSYRNQNESR